ncbi:hypothetical protein FRC02_011552 [Tulasnella sp. 418]|nr:hypothetical protein FRC02_011552 [Tulasnella sp. 418]
MSTCIDLLWRKEPLTKKDILGIIITSPEVLDNLLTLSSYARVKLFPKKKSDSSAIMLLCFFMMFPVNNLMNKDSIEFRAATQCNRILLAREDAMIHLVCARGKAGFADASSIFKLMQEDEGGRYYNMAKNLMAKIEMRTAGALGICSLRIMMNFALLEDVPTGVLFTILPVAYSACGRAPTEAEVNAAKRRDPARGRQTETIRQQRHIYEVQLRPQHQLGLNDSLVRKLQMYIPPETMMGPTLLFRVLKRLAERGCNLDLMRKSIEIPLEDQYISTPLPSLYHVYQIVDSKVIGKLIRLCVNRRIPQRRELGNTLIANKPNLAKPTYDSAMQLAQAVVSFGMDPENAGLEGVIENSDAIKRAYQEMVLCTGNYSEAAAAMKDWEIAITYAQNAIELCRKFPMEEAVAMGWDVISTEQKNIRRLKRYLRGLEAKDAAMQ